MRQARGARALEASDSSEFSRAPINSGAQTPVHTDGSPLGRGVFTNSTSYRKRRSVEFGRDTLTGNGGSQVGPFSVSTNFQADLTVTNWDSVTAIDRSRPLTLNWTGSGFDQVVILASTGTVIGANQHLVTITCTVPGSLGSYSVPTAALAYLQPSSSTSFGAVSVTALSTPVPFTAAVAGGGQIDLGGFGTSFAVGGKSNIPVQ